jgi:hypothetical protein
MNNLTPIQPPLLKPYVHSPVPVSVIVIIAILLFIYRIYRWLTTNQTPTLTTTLSDDQILTVSSDKDLHYIESVSERYPTSRDPKRTRTVQKILNPTSITFTDKVSGKGYIYGGKIIMEGNNKLILDFQTVLLPPGEYKIERITYLSPHTKIKHHRTVTNKIYFTII